MISASVSISFTIENGQWLINAAATSEDGRKISITAEAGDQTAGNYDRMYNMILGQLGKSAGHYRFSIESVKTDGELPFMSTSALNAIRRKLAEELDVVPCGKKDILLRKPGKVTKPLPQKDITYKTNISNQISEDFYREAGAERIDRAYELRPVRTAELMRTKYCIRFELGLCPKYQGGKAPGQLFLLNNGQKFALHFDCKACEMTLTQA